MEPRPDQAKKDATNSKDARREFLKNVGKASVALPAAALLLAASEKAASAQEPPSGACI